MLTTQEAGHDPRGQGQGGEVLQLVFEHTGEGISVFDAELKLRAWNWRFIHFTGLPPELVVPGTPLVALLRAMAELGEFGPCDAETESARRLALLSEDVASVTQRTRPNGRSIELRRSPTPGGGFVMLYADITERLQTEAQLQQTGRLLAQKSGVPEATLQEVERLSREKPVVRLVNDLLQEAVRRRASDVHLQPYEDRMQIRYRVDGVLYEMESIPKKAKGSLTIHSSMPNKLPQ